MDPGYVEWVKGSELMGHREAAQLQRLVDYIRAREDPTAWDQAYKEGIASKLRKQARAAQKEGQATRDALALGSKATLQQRMVERLGIKLKRGGNLQSLDSCQLSRQRGSMDASAIDLRQQQIEQGDHLALPAPGALPYIVSARGLVRASRALLRCGPGLLSHVHTSLLSSWASCRLWYRRILGLYLAV